MHAPLTCKSACGPKAMHISGVNCKASDKILSHIYSSWPVITAILTKALWLQLHSEEDTRICSITVYITITRYNMLNRSINVMWRTYVFSCVVFVITWSLQNIIDDWWCVWYSTRWCLFKYQMLHQSSFIQRPWSRCYRANIFLQWLQLLYQVTVRHLWNRCFCIHVWLQQRIAQI